VGHLSDKDKFRLQKFLVKLRKKISGMRLRKVIIRRLCLCLKWWDAKKILSLMDSMMF